MPSYPTGEPSQYYVNDPQAGAYNDPRQFDPYITHQPALEPARRNAYDTGEYREPYEDEPTSYSFPQGQSMEPLGPNTKEEVSFYVDESNPIPREPRSARSLRAWRYQQGRRLWTQGSRPRCLCRFFFCTVLITLFLVAIIALCLALWIQPPDIVIGGDNTSVSPVVAQGVNLLSDGFQINLGLPIEVLNPNYIGVKLVHVNAQIFYPINNTIIGNGEVFNVNLPAHANTNFTFPFAFDYSRSIDPNSAIITDIASKCLASPQGDLKITYKISVAVRVFFITISPTISNPMTFACPLSATELENIIKQIGLGSIIGSGA